MTKKRKKFVEALAEIAMYWDGKENAAMGAIFSTLVMFDGMSGLNDFEEIDIKGITNGCYLHDEFCEAFNEMKEKTK